jgi:DNA-binding Xre family transcriptional regulator
MEVEIKSIQDLMRFRKISRKELAEKTGISESTIQRHLEDCKWDVSQIDALVTALEIPKSFLVTFFYDPYLEIKSSEAKE